MKKKLVCLLILSLIIVSLFAGCMPAEDRGDAPLPEETATDSVITPETEKSPAADTGEPYLRGDLVDFAGQSVSGEQASVVDLCAEYDLTMVNFFATWCGPCVSEMPGLQSMYEGGMGVIGIWLDPESPKDLANIMENVKITYPIIEFQEQMASVVELAYIPVTIFLDREGYMVGDPVVGANSEEGWQKEINARLSAMEIQ